MVLQLKLRKSRSPPGFEASALGSHQSNTLMGAQFVKNPFAKLEKAAAGVSPSGGFSVLAGSQSNTHEACRTPYPADVGDAGWSSPVARQAHNLKVVGSNPTPATNKKPAFERVFLRPHCVRFRSIIPVSAWCSQDAKNGGVAPSVGYRWTGALLPFLGGSPREKRLRDHSNQKRMSFPRLPNCTYWLALIHQRRR
jgi:hypothetical protein